MYESEKQQTDAGRKANRQRIVTIALAITFCLVRIWVFLDLILTEKIENLSLRQLSLIRPSRATKSSRL